MLEFLKKLLGTSNESQLKKLRKTVDAVNALGDVRDPHTGEWLAGAQRGGMPLDTTEYLLSGGLNQCRPGTNTTIGVVATNAKLSKEQVNRLALCAHDGFARTIFPSHTLYDGDTVFGLSTLFGGETDFLTLCTAAAETMARAVANAVTRRG